MAENQEYISTSPDDTKELAEKLKPKLSEGTLVALLGDLGSGKTFFVKEFCRLHNIDYAVSPTFTLANIYEGDITVQHLDFYRIKEVRELYDIGIDEYINNSDAVTFIEWAGLFPEVLPEKYLCMEFQITDDLQRKISITEYESK